MEHQTHYFFAVKIPDHIKLVMKKNCELLSEKLPFSRWVHHQDLHITLAFLGSAPAEKLQIAEHNVKEALTGTKILHLQFNQLGIFGKKDSPRIFWVDTQESSELQMIRKKVFTACQVAGFQLETRPFRPHITLARKWRGEGPFQLETLDIWKKIQPEPIEFEALDVVLYQTHLNQTPKYEVITRFPLE